MKKKEAQKILDLIEPEFNYGLNDYQSFSIEELKSFKQNLQNYQSQMFSEDINQDGELTDEGMAFEVDCDVAIECIENEIKRRES